MNALTFASPEWFWGLLVILPLLMLRAWSHWRSAKQLPGLVSPRLASRLITGSSHSRRWVVFILHCLAVTATLEFVHGQAAANANANASPAPSLPAQRTLKQ